MAKKHTFPEENCWSCPHYQRVGGITRYCNGFKRRKARRFRNSDPSTKAPKWCPRRMSPPICRILGFKDERAEFMESLFQRDCGSSSYILPSAQHYVPRQEINLGLTAKRFYDEMQEHYLQDVLPPDVEVKTGEIIEINDGLKPYYFHVKNYGTVIPLQFFQLQKKGSAD